MLKTSKRPYLQEPSPLPGGNGPMVAHGARPAFLLLFFILLFTALAHAAEYPPDIQRIVDRGELIVAMYYKDIPPFFMHGDEKNFSSRHRGVPSPFLKGKYFYGVDVSLALGIAEGLNVPCRFHRKSKDFNEIVDTVFRHEADIAITLLSRTLDRSKKLLFTAPYVTLHHGVLLNRLALAAYQKGSSLKAFLNRPDMRIGVKGGIAWPGFLKHYFPHATVVEYPEWEPNVIDAVRGGEVMAAYADELEIKKLIISKPDASIELKTVIIKDIKDPISVAVAWDSPHLLQWINTYLAEQQTAMTVDDILERHLDSVMGKSSSGISPQEQ